MPDDETASVALPLAPKARRGRPKKRHDPAPAPVDGDYALDHIVNKEAGWDYALVSVKDRPGKQSRGWQPERWGAGCARKLWDYGEHKDGDEVKVEALTLMKIPTERRAAINKHERAWHDNAKAALKKVAENTGGRMTTFSGVQF